MVVDLHKNEFVLYCDRELVACDKIFTKNLHIHSVSVFIHYLLSAKLDGWMTCNFTSFLTVFQSYQDDVRMT